MDTSEDFATQDPPRTITQEESFSAALISSPNAPNAIYTRPDTRGSSDVSPLIKQQDMILKRHQKHKQPFEMSSNMDKSWEEDAESPGASPTVSLNDMYKREPLREYTNSPTRHMQETSPRMLLKNAMEVDKMPSPQSMSGVSPQSFKNKLTPQLFLAPPTPATCSSINDSSPQQPSTVSSKKRRTSTGTGEHEMDLFILDSKSALKVQEPDIKRNPVEEDILTPQPSTPLSLMQYFDEKGLTGNVLEICEMLNNEV